MFTSQTHVRSTWTMDANERCSSNDRQREEKEIKKAYLLLRGRRSHPNYRIGHQKRSDEFFSLSLFLLLNTQNSIFVGWHTWNHQLISLQKESLVFGIFVNDSPIFYAFQTKWTKKRRNIIFKWITVWPISHTSLLNNGIHSNYYTRIENKWSKEVFAHFSMYIFSLIPSTHFVLIMTRFSFIKMFSVGFGYNNLWLLSIYGPYAVSSLRIDWKCGNHLAFEFSGTEVFRFEWWHTQAYA